MFITGGLGEQFGEQNIYVWMRRHRQESEWIVIPGSILFIEGHDELHRRSLITFGIRIEKVSPGLDCNLSPFSSLSITVAFPVSVVLIEIYTFLDLEVLAGIPAASAQGSSLISLAHAERLPLLLLIARLAQ